MTEFKKYKHKESGKEWEVSDECLNGSDPTIGLWQWRSASVITGIDFTYTSATRQEFAENYEPIN
jgi:hypothetical protein